MLVLPFQAAELKTGGLRPVFSAVDALGPSSVVFNVVSNAFLKAHPDTVRAMLSDYVGALRYLYTPGKPRHRRVRHGCIDQVAASPRWIM